MIATIVMACARYRVVVLAALLATTNVAWIGAAGGEGVQRMTILHTSDLHGQVLPFDDARDAPHPGSLAQIATLVEEVRSEVDHPVMVFDSGDTIQGSPFEQFTHVRWGRPSPTVGAMNRIGYDAMAVGNHEFNFGLEVLRRAEGAARFPFLSANTVFEESCEPAFRPYVVLEVGALRLGVLGLITPNIPGWEQPEHYRGLQFEPMDQAARHWVSVLREQEGCDLVVVLAHTGLERDLETGAEDGTAYENFAWRLLQVEGIDLLLTGHSHQNISPRKVGDVIVSQPRARAEVLTRIDLELERSPAGWRVVDWQGRNLTTASAAEHPSFQAAFAAARAEVVAALNQPLTTATASVSVQGCRLVDCAAVDLIHSVQLDLSGADVSLASLLTDRTPDLEPGPVSWRWVNSLYTYPNTLVAVNLTGQQVKDVLEHAARYYDGLECSAGHGCTVLTDPGVRRYNVDNMAGVQYRIDPTMPEGERVRDLRYQGLPLDLHQTFKVVCNNYRAAGGGLFPHLADAEVVWKSSEEVAQLIGDFLARNDPWQPTVDANWWIGRGMVAERTPAISDG